MIALNWKKCGEDGHWCSLQHLDLDTVEGAGVYIIWFAGNPGRVVRIGQGAIADRLAKHRLDPHILAYELDRTLRVTWASVPAHQMDGVERYLSDTWHPLIGDAFPDAVPIAVNSPW